MVAQCIEFETVYSLVSSTMPMKISEAVVLCVIVAWPSTIDHSSSSAPQRELRFSSIVDSSTDIVLPEVMQFALMEVSLLCDVVVYLGTQEQATRTSDRSIRVVGNLRSFGYANA